MRRHVMVKSSKTTLTDTNSPQCRLIQFMMILQSVMLLLLLATQPLMAKPLLMSAKTAHQSAQNGEIILVDIRTPEEWLETGIGEGAIALDMTSKRFITSLVKLRQTYPEKQIAFICATGGRSSYLIRYLTKNGFGNTADVSEGMLGSRAGPGWLKIGLPIYAGQTSEIENRLRAVLPK